MSDLLDWQLLALTGRKAEAAVALRDWYAAEKDKHAPYISEWAGSDRDAE